MPYYALVGKNISGYMTEMNNTGNLLEWNNDVVKITFFEGVDNYNFTYNPNELSLIHI